MLECITAEEGGGPFSSLTYPEVMSMAGLLEGKVALVPVAAQVLAGPQRALLPGKAPE